MELVGIREKDKKTLASLAVEFGKDFSNKSGGNGTTIGLYGCDCEVMDFFQNKLEVYLLGRDINASVRQNSLGGYNIDIGFFLRAGYVSGLNKDVEHICSY